jgi:hypothetical protein
MLLDGSLPSEEALLRKTLTASPGSGAAASSRLIFSETGRFGIGPKEIIKKEEFHRLGLFLGENKEKGKENNVETERRNMYSHSNFRLLSFP